MKRLPAARHVLVANGDRRMRSVRNKERKQGVNLGKKQKPALQLHPARQLPWPALEVRPRRHRICRNEVVVHVKDGHPAREEMGPKTGGIHCWDHAALEAAFVPAWGLSFRPT